MANIKLLVYPSCFVSRFIETIHFLVSKESNTLPTGNFASLSRALNQPCCNINSCMCAPLTPLTCKTQSMFIIRDAAEKIEILTETRPSKNLRLKSFSVQRQHWCNIRTCLLLHKFPQRTAADVFRNIHNILLDLIWFDYFYCRCAEKPIGICPGESVLWYRQILFKKGGN